MPDDTQPNAALPDALRSRIERSRVALALASGQGDMPLDLVNRAFSTLTGYDADQVVGRNCRFLQGPDTPPAQVRDMRDFLADDDRDDGRFPVLNRTRDGRDFVNLVFMSKLRARDGALRFVIASQFDATRTHGVAAQTESTAELSASVSDLRRAAHEFGLIMADSSELIARSISTLARLSLRDE